MDARTFIAGSAAEAVERIRRELGPQAVVLNVRQLPAEGLARLWQKPRIEVVAAAAPPAPAPDPIAELRQELAEIRQRVAPAASGRTSSGGLLPADDGPAAAASAAPGASAWRLAPILERSGLLPMHIQRLRDEVAAAAETAGPASLGDELALVRRILAGWWPRGPLPETGSGVHVFIGPPGTGKTTALCKWLAKSVLGSGVPARVWRLDGRTANTAEALSVFAEIMGVAVERFQPAEPPAPGELVLVDLPGVPAGDPDGLLDLQRRLAGFPGAAVHLVLNAAYEGPVLLAQGRGFRGLPISDLILTHLDEDSGWGKIWNLVLGTKYTVAFLGAGQNIPGNFEAAEPGRILGRFLPGK